MAATFTYDNLAVEVHGVTPNVGPTAGGELAYIFGRNFRDGAISITFGGVAATDIGFIDGSSITCHVPAHAEELVNVIVIIDTDTIALLSAFRYEDEQIFNFSLGGIDGNIDDTYLRFEPAVKITKTMGQADTCTFTTELEPAGNEWAQVNVFGMSLFLGKVVRYRHTYEDDITKWIFNVTCSGTNLVLNQLRPIGIWPIPVEAPGVATLVSATEILTELFDQYATNFRIHIQSSLPSIAITLDGTSDMSTAITNICQLAGAKWLVDGFDVYVFTLSASYANPPATITDDNPDLIHMSSGQGAAIEWDYSQIRNSVMVRGGNGLMLWVEDPESIVLWGRRQFVVNDTTLLTYADLEARGRLEWILNPIPTVAYSTRDMNTAPAKRVLIDLENPPVFGDFIIQTVGIDQINEADNCKPRFTVSAIPLTAAIQPLISTSSGIPGVIQAVADLQQAVQQVPELHGDVESPRGGPTTIPLASVRSSQLAGCINGTQLSPHTVTPDNLAPTGVAAATYGDPSLGITLDVNAAGQVVGASSIPHVIGEQPTGTINGTNQSYTTSRHFVRGSVQAHLNGLRLIKADYTEIAPNIVYMRTPPQTGDDLTVDYA